MQKKKIIEKSLPLRELSASAMTDKAHKGHPGNLHLWWNRSPIASSSAVLLAGISDECDNRAEELLINIARNDSSAVHIAKEHIKSLGERIPVVVDPFSGFGGLTIAGKIMGFPVVAGDLNALATILTKAITEIPSHFESVSAVHPRSQKEIESGIKGLAADVAFYGKRIGEDAKRILRPIYPKEAGKETFSWIWVRSTECANPTCKCEMPLSSSFVLSQKKDKEYWAEPVLEGRTVFKIHQGICPKERSTNKVGSMGAKFSCPFCGEVVTDDYVKKQGMRGKLRNLLMAVSVDSKDGKEFYSPSYEQMQAVNISVPDDFLAGELPNNTRWFSPPGFGMKEYKDLFTTRQFKMLCEFSDLIKKYRAVIVEDAKSAGMDDDGKALKDGGKGALAYGQAVSVYLALVLSRMVNYHSTICTWDNRKGNLRAAFTRQAIPMTWTYAEANPFSEITGNYESCLMNVVESIQNLPCEGCVKVQQADGITMKFPGECILFTELPYLDNVGYADLSDYFYIWLRRSLIDVYPALFEKIVTSKEELSSIPEHYGNDAIKGKEAYAEGMQKLFLNFKQNAARDYPSMVFFEYSKSDEAAITGELGETSTWEMFLGCIIEAGFQIMRVWPIRTEKANEQFESVRVLVVFRHRDEDARQITRRAWINVLRKELPDLLNTDYANGIDEEDKMIVAMGQGLAIFTRYRCVLNADGTGMCVHDALELIHQETEDYMKLHSKELQGEENTVGGVKNAREL